MVENKINLKDSNRRMRLLLDELIELRKSVPRSLSDTYARRNKVLAKCFKEIKINLYTNSEFATCNKDVDTVLENINIEEVKSDKRNVDELYKQVQLLKFLITKKNCPISKIIDDI